MEADPSSAEALPLFAATQTEAAEPVEPTGPSLAESTLADIDPDTLTPKEALELIYKLKSLS